VSESASPQIGVARANRLRWSPATSRWAIAGPRRRWAGA